MTLCNVAFVTSCAVLVLACPTLSPMYRVPASSACYSISHIFIAPSLPISGLCSRERPGIPKLILPSEHWGGALVAKIFSTGAAVTVQPWAAILFFFGHLVVGTEGFLQSGPF